MCGMKRNKIYTATITEYTHPKETDVVYVNIVIDNEREESLQYKEMREERLANDH